MADKVLCDKSDLVNIADAVRSKLGVTDTYYVSELSSAIQNIQTGGEIETINGYILNNLGVPIKVFYFDGANTQSRSLPSGSNTNFDVQRNSILCTVETNGNLKIDVSMPDTGSGERLFLSNTTHIISLTASSFVISYSATGGGSGGGSG